MREEILEYVKTLPLITNFSELVKGDKIFNKESFKVEYVDIFDHMEKWENGIDMICYVNYFGELRYGVAENFLYYADIVDHTIMSSIENYITQAKSNPLRSIGISGIGVQKTKYIEPTLTNVLSARIELKNNSDYSKNI